MQIKDAELFGCRDEHLMVGWNAQRIDLDLCRHNTTPSLKVKLAHNHKPWPIYIYNTLPDSGPWLETMVIQA